MYSALDANRYLWTFDPMNRSFLMTLQNEAHELMEDAVNCASTKNRPSHPS